MRTLHKSSKPDKLLQSRHDFAQMSTLSIWQWVASMRLTLCNRKTRGELLTLARAAWDFLETLEYQDYHHRFILILETLTCPDLTPHEAMRQEKAVSQYKPLAARDTNGNWSKVEDYEVRKAGRGNFLTTISKVH